MQLFVLLLAEVSFWIFNDSKVALCKSSSKDNVLDFYLLHAAENRLRDNLKDSIYLQFLLLHKINAGQSKDDIQVDKKYWHFLQEISSDSHMPWSPLDSCNSQDSSTHFPDDTGFA